MTEKEEVLLDPPLSERRKKLESFAKQFQRSETFFLSPITLDIEQVRAWLKKTGDNLDGIVCKWRDNSYQSGVSSAFQKVKHYRSIDCVVGGFRYARRSDLVGSLLLGIYNESGKLNHVGFTSGIKADERAGLTQKLEKLISPPRFDGDAPGGKSRWTSGSSRDWKPLRPELVVEVRYDHLPMADSGMEPACYAGGRIQHQDNGAITNYQSLLATCGSCCKKQDELASARILAIKLNKINQRIVW